MNAKHATFWKPLAAACILVLAGSGLAACARGDARRETDGGTIDDAAADGTDPCASATCSSLAACSPVGESFECTCLAGYAGDGEVCDDIDECTEGIATCHPAATCTNFEGSFECICGLGYVGDGEVCDDIDECTEGIATCHEAATCTNTEGSFECACDEGYSGDGFSCVAAPVDYPVGGRDQSWSMANFWRGNIYHATSSTRLDHFEVHLDVTDGCALGFYVLSSSTVDGAPSVVWSATTTASGLGYHSSGPIDLTTETDTYYTLGVGWDCLATYYSAPYDSMVGTFAGIGTLEGNAFHNSYPGYSPTFLPSSGRAGGAHYDQIVSIAP
ncbi:MAG: EGF-like domain-containing protein [Myxococcales bacterium]|nr:EGF-like domain-containing protein [Myxococcales bacterium]